MSQCLFYKEDVAKL